MDSRFPTHYLNDRRVLRLDPRAFRLFVMATAWSVTNMTDGIIGREDLPLIPLGDHDRAGDLVASGLWAESDQGYEITEFQKHQTSAAQLENAFLQRKELDRQRKERQRKHEKGDHSMCIPGNCPELPPSEEESRDGHGTSEGKVKARQGVRDSPDSEEKVDMESEEIDSGAPQQDWWDQHITAAWDSKDRLIKLGKALKAEHPNDERLHAMRDRTQELEGPAQQSEVDVYQDPAWANPQVPSFARRS